MTMTVTVTMQDTAEVVKKMVQARTGIPIDDQVLEHHGRVMEDGKQLREHGVSRHATLHMSAKLRGGTTEEEFKQMLQVLPDQVQDVTTSLEVEKAK